MEDTRTKLRYFIWPIVVGVGVVLGIFVSIFALENKIEKIVLEKLKDPVILKEVAYYLRPSMTFDQNGTILSDSGAGKFVKELKIVMGKYEPETIILSPTEHLNAAPILESLNYTFTYSAKRINSSDWQYSLRSPNYLLIEGPGLKEWIFRVEIIR